MDSIKAVLFDLDGTLLDVNIDDFLPVYIEALAAHLADLIPPERFIPQLMQASQAMMANDGRATNQVVFDRAFFPPLGRTRQELEPRFMDFYANVYPELRHHARRNPEARLAVQAAFDRGYDVAICTNPLFPRTAVEQRLEWAGVADFPYRLITTYENSCAAKPNRLYFERVLEVIRHPAEACLMVGDEEMDMAAARVGCPTFLVPGGRTEQDANTPEPTYRGTLSDLIALFNATQ